MCKKTQSRIPPYLSIYKLKHFQPIFNPYSIIDSDRADLSRQHHQNVAFLSLISLKYLEKPRWDLVYGFNRASTKKMGLAWVEGFGEGKAYKMKRSLLGKSTEKA